MKTNLTLNNKMLLKVKLQMHHEEKPEMCWTSSAPETDGEVGVRVEGGVYQIARLSQF